MLELTISSGASRPFECKLREGRYLIGRGQEAQIRLRDVAISERHAMLCVSQTGAELEDVGSSNGTTVNGERLRQGVPQALYDGDTVAVGSYSIAIKSGAAAPAEPPTGGQPAQPPAGAMPPVADKPRDEATIPVRPAGEAPAPRQEASRQSDIRRQIKNQIHRELVQRMELKRFSADRTAGDALSARAKAKLDEIIAEAKNRGKLPKDIDPAELASEIFDEAMKLGPLETFLADDSISEIMVNGPHKIYVERRGKLELTNQNFMDDASVLAVIERIVSPIGRRIDESQPYVDARLPDGSRVNAIIPPLALTGPCITIRKFSKTPLTVQDFTRFGTWTPAIAHFLEICVKMRKNIIVAGGTGSGKTTLLNLLSSFIPDGERIVTIEDAAELRLEQPHLVRLESRPPNIEGQGAITIRDLVRNALRMRPDRIIVGECRGGEALDMLQAMNTGHDGSLTTVHANSPRDVISRLETMVLMSGMELPSRAIREQISSAVDLIVHESRFADGSRRITHVSEVMGLEGDQTVMQDIFEFRQTGVSAEGRIEGYISATGAVPSFFEQIKQRGLELDPAVFNPSGENGGIAP